MANIHVDINLPGQESLLWLPLPSRLDDPAGSTSLTRRQVRSWGLVLEARRLSCRPQRRGFGWELLVPADTFERAVSELISYETENHGWPPPPPQPTPLIENRVATLWVLIGIALFYNLTLHDINLFEHHPVDWTVLGNAHAGKILQGEWWRTITALTLHADWQHLLGNLLIGGVFITLLCRDLGSGLGWSLLLASGVLGNLFNAWVQSPGHRAVGASTAVFGAVGLLAAISMVRYRHNLRPRKRWPLPVAAALGLLAMLGAGGENTDLGAHLFGFLFGLGLGFGSELAIEKLGRPRRSVGILMALLAAGLVSGAWWLALTAGH